MKVLPPTLNDIIAHARGNKFASAAIKKKWTEGIAAACHNAKVQPVTGHVFLEYIWRVKNFQRDQDNVTSAQKYILDGLVAGGVIEQDNLFVIQPPVIHHFVKSDHDGFSVFVRDTGAWLERLRVFTDELGQAPAVTNEIVLSVLLSTGNATRRLTKARPRARARTVPTSRRRITRLA